VPFFLRRQGAFPDERHAGENRAAMKKYHFHRACLLGALLLPFSAANLLKSFAQQSEPIRVSVNRVNVGVIVSTADGDLVDGLRRQDFQVFDNGVETAVTGFVPVDDPAKVLLLIEAGPAVYLLEGGHLNAAYALLTGLSADDQVAVVRYDEAPKAICAFTADKNIATEAFEKLNFNLGFGALNLSASLATVLDWLASTQGKKTVVLLSTGVDTSAPAVTEQLLQRLRVADTRVLAVSLAGEMRTTTVADKKKKALSNAAVLSAQQFAEADEALRQLAGATGGRAFFPANAKEFAAVYREIALMVRHEYSLAIAPQLDGSLHRIAVRVAEPVAGGSRAGWRVDHRQGYVAPRGQAP
jgi:Ca-activated chloride channel family protein